ncbi:hypothetical protein [Sphingobacterium sp.]|uniref:hypothetical protein n=1 Tax=Sphingobacterium sp. TaxID=341027 RepID=UPI00289C1C1E|nr:hypothetical protein [Sphingobacterium sp.]
MRPLHFVIFGKNSEILKTLKRIIENTSNWNATIQEEISSCKNYLKDNRVDIILLSSGLSLKEERDIVEHLSFLDYPIALIQHYGGGSGLLKNEVYSLFPELIPDK